MKPTLVAYFSVDDATTKAAKRVAGLAGAEDFRIEAQEPYTADDLDWTAAEARCNIEMEDAGCRPALKEPLPFLKGYGTILLGYPVWWGKAPRVIDTFLDSFDLAGHKIVPFCTSGGASVADSVAELKKFYPDAEIGEGLRIKKDTTDEEILAWAKQ